MSNNLKTRKSIRGLAATMMIAAFAVANAQTNGARVAVAPFNSPFNNSYNYSAFGGQLGAAEFASFGPMISDLVAGELVNKGVLVVERSNLDKVITEQLRVDSGAFDDSTAVAIGKLALANVAVVGSVNEFSYTQRRIGFGPLSYNEIEARVGVSLRVVDVQTGTVFAVFNDRVSKKVGKIDASQVIAGILRNNNIPGGWGTTGQREATWGSFPVLSDATRDLAKKAAGLFAAKVTDFAKTAKLDNAALTGACDAKVLDVTGDEIVVELDTRFAKGDRVTVSRCEGEIKNDEGRVVKRKMRTIGTGVVVEVSPQGGATIRFTAVAGESVKAKDSVSIDKEAK